MNRAANQIAHAILAHRGDCEEPVTLLLERGTPTVAAILGALKAGKIYVPLDPSFPLARNADIVKDAAPKLIVVDHEHFALASSLAGDGAAIINIDALDTSTDNPGLKLAPDRLAYVIYTSGSTGKPKGVCIAHRALANLLQAMCEHIAEEDSLLAVTTLSFDIAALELYLPLIAGARLVLASRETAADGEALSKCLADCRITLMQAPPATWRLLIEAGWQGSGKLRVLCGGEALPRELADQLLAGCASLSNLYGPPRRRYGRAVSACERISRFRSAARSPTPRSTFSMAR